MAEVGERLGRGILFTPLYTIIKLTTKRNSSPKTLKVTANPIWK